MPAFYSLLVPPARITQWPDRQASQPFVNAYSHPVILFFFRSTFLAVGIIFVIFASVVLLFRLGVVVLLPEYEQLLSILWWFVRLFLFAVACIALAFTPTFIFVPFFVLSAAAVVYLMLTESQGTVLDMIIA